MMQKYSKLIQWTRKMLHLFVVRVFAWATLHDYYLISP